MKITWLNFIPLWLLLLLMAIPLSKPADANLKYRFLCLSRQDPQSQQLVPTTVAWQRQGKIDLIRWKTRLGGTSPQKRCEEVSPRLQKAYENNSLRLLTNGYINNQPVICTVKEYGGNCENLIMTVNSPDEGRRLINAIKDNLNGYIVGPYKHSDQIFVEINLDEYLRNAPLDTNP